MARVNYLAVDRGDFAFCVNGLARCMSSPSRQDWERLRRLSRGSDAYSGMHIKVHPARSFASLTATGPDGKEHVDPHLVDA